MGLPSVLIVEDEAVMAMLLEKMIGAKGFHVLESVSTKEDAVNAAVEGHPDFIIMDIRLSGDTDGIEAAKEIIEKIHTRIIFSTGYSNEKTVKEAMKVKPVAYLIKPFEISELVSIMKKNNKKS
ncbi:MAG TPA: response regulator [Chitinispirillaceae bacterium]|nr:response regulator [Chitinispirillaceae bacterium]